MNLLPTLRSWTARLSRGARAALLCGCLALVIGAASVVIPLVEGSEEACRPAPEWAAGLAANPREATKDLDPKADLSRLGPLRKLLQARGEPLCPGPEGAGVAGRALLSATTGRTASAQDGPAAAHSAAMARVTYAAVLVLSGEDDPSGTPDFPTELAPSLGRVLAAYIGDVRRHISGTSQGDGSVVVGHDDYLAGPFPHPEEYHPDFSHRPGAGRTLVPVVRRLAADPEAFAALYDAERAYLAYYLNRLNDGAEEPGTESEVPLLGTRLEISDGASLVATLMSARARHAEEGTIPDPAAFDRAVLRHTRGLYGTQPHRLRGLLPLGAIALYNPDEAPNEALGRAVADRSETTELLMDGRHQELSVLEAWAEQRGVPAARVARLRSSYVETYLHVLHYD